MKVLNIFITYKAYIENPSGAQFVSASMSVWDEGFLYRNNVLLFYLSPSNFAGVRTMNITTGLRSHYLSFWEF